MSTKELMLLNCDPGEDWVCWTTRRSNQSILKEIIPEYSLKGLTTEAEPPILWPPDVKSRLTGKDSDTGKDPGQEEKGQQRMRWLDDISDSMDMSLRKLWEIVKEQSLACCSPWCHRTGCNLVTEWLTTLLPRGHDTDSLQVTAINTGIKCAVIVTLIHILY